MRSIDASFLKEAIKSELDSIVSNHTWDLSDLPKGCKPISSKWIFKKKLRPDGTIEKYKAILVITGFNQKKDIDYYDTYSPVTKIATIRTLVAVAAIHNLPAIIELLEDIGLEDEDDIVVTLVPKTGGEFVAIKSAVIKLEAC
ncbi:PREDICTED: uncharacterized protein LOC109234819 [Nicotiana attenuata]|uniref:uncharacterized protein LOC109234819 n=1 Tax=Nicotiana attenuata TaxID=49451 RepID=UPI0009046891|nr:PREDICTED: uncharacterized protein LOC109234819 [Nicotiana attenuata]